MMLFLILLIQLIGWFFTSAIMVRMRGQGRLFTHLNEGAARADLFLWSFFWVYTIPFYFLKKLWFKIATPKEGI